MPFRGAYARLAAARADLVRALIYPVPDPRLPFLGVHLTRTLGGDVLVGPTALLAGARDAYSLRRVRARDVADTLAWPGTLADGAPLVAHRSDRVSLAASRRALARAAARYVPQIVAADLEPAFAGVRAQAAGA